MSENTIHQFVIGSARAAKLAAKMIDAGLWFEVTPWAEDMWRFDVKAESDNKERLTAAVDAMYREIDGVTRIRLGESK